MEHLQGKSEGEVLEVTIESARSLLSGPEQETPPLNHANKNKNLSIAQQKKKGHFKNRKVFLILHMVKSYSI